MMDPCWFYLFFPGRIFWAAVLKLKAFASSADLTLCGAGMFGCFILPPVNFPA